MSICDNLKCHQTLPNVPWENNHPWLLCILLTVIFLLIVVVIAKGIFNILTCLQKLFLFLHFVWKIHINPSLVLV